MDTKRVANRGEAEERCRPIQTFLLGPFHKRIVLVISPVVLLFVAAAVLMLRYLSGPVWHIQMLLHSEAQALEAGDQEMFFFLQDSANEAWLRYQRNKFNSQQWARERGEAWALEPVPRPRVVSVELQGGEAWAEVVWREWDTKRRKVEFFRHANDEWKHAGPNVQFWGSPRDTRTTYLHWTYRERDEEWVADLLDEGERIYQQASRDFGLIPAEHQVTIEVGYSLDAPYLLFYPEGPMLSLLSPFLIGTTDGDESQMEQLLGALLINYLAGQAIGGDVAEVTGARRAALDAIRDWETWQVSFQEREPYWEAPLLQAIEAGELLPLSEVWGEDEPEAHALALSQSYTLIDYVVARYGRQSIAALLAALGSSSSLEEALQKALGPDLTMARLESDWMAFIWARYAIAGALPAVTPAPEKTSTSAPTVLPTLLLPATPLPLPSEEGMEAYRNTMRAGYEDEAETITDLSHYELAPNTMVGITLANSETITDLSHYELALRADLENGTLLGRERLVFVNQEDEALEDILLRLYPQACQAESIRVGRVSIDGEAVDSAYQAGDTALLVSLPRPLADGERITLDLDFAVHLQAPSEGVWSVAFFQPMLAVYEDGDWRQDAVSCGPDAVFSQSAYYAVRLALPEAVAVAASGVEVEVLNNGDGTVIRSYRGGPLRGFALFMSEDFQVFHETVNGVRLNTWYLPADRDTGQAVLQYVVDAVTVFDEHLGPYPYAELDAVVIPDAHLAAGMATGVEYPTLVVVRHGEASDLEFVAAHEVAHQWWYGIVGNDVLQEPWLDESFANYSAILYYEKAHGREAARGVYQERVLSRYESIQGSDLDGPVGRSIQDFAEAGYPSAPILYGKGAVFLDTLRQKVGDPVFFSLLQAYYRRYQYQVATGEGFLAVAEEVAGQDLDEIYEAWVEK